MPAVPKPAPTASSRAKMSKRKGRKAESEAAAILGGERVPLSGSLGGNLSGDVVDAQGRIYEVKVRADGFKQHYRWLRVVPGYGVNTIKRTVGVERGREKAPFALLTRADNSPWMVTMLLADWVAEQTEMENLRAEAGE